jgi:hypothetical protein
VGGAGVSHDLRLRFADCVGVGGLSFSLCRRLNLFVGLFGVAFGENKRLRFPVFSGYDYIIIHD